MVLQAEREKVSQELITAVRESINSDTTTAIATTTNWKMLANKIGFLGKADPQQLIEWTCELSDMPEDERAGRGKQLANLFTANEIHSKMTAVHATHKTGSTKDRA